MQIGRGQAAVAIDRLALRPRPARAPAMAIGLEPTSEWV